MDSFWNLEARAQAILAIVADKQQTPAVRSLEPDVRRLLVAMDTARQKQRADNELSDTEVRELTRRLEGLKSKLRALNVVLEEDTPPPITRMEAPNGVLLEDE